MSSIAILSQQLHVFHLCSDLDVSLAPDLKIVSWPLFSRALLYPWLMACCKIYLFATSVLVFYWSPCYLKDLIYHLLDVWTWFCWCVSGWTQWRLHFMVKQSSSMMPSCSVCDVRLITLRWCFVILLSDAPRAFFITRLWCSIAMSIAFLRPDRSTVFTVLLCVTMYRYGIHWEKSAFSIARRSAASTEL